MIGRWDHHPGFEVRLPVADLRALQPGTHLVALYGDDTEQTRVAAAFVSAGLAAGDQVLYVGSDRNLSAVAASMKSSALPVESALSTGQMLTRGIGEAFGTVQTPLTEIASGFRSTATQARADGFAQLRVAAEMTDVVAVLGSASRVIEWERLATQVLRADGIITVCQYGRKTLDGAMAALISGEHDGSAPDKARPAQATFHATADGLRVSGELDFRNRSDFINAVRARLRACRQLRLEFSEVSFADAGVAEHLHRIAAELPEDKSIIVVNPPAELSRVLGLPALSHSRLALEPDRL